MVRVLSRSFALLFSVLLVGAAGIFLAASVHWRDSWFGQPLCVCILSIRQPVWGVETRPWGQTWGWQRTTLAGTNFYLPRGYALQNVSEAGRGSADIVGPDGVLHYRLDGGDPRPVMQGGRNSVQRTLTMNGRRAFMVTAEFPGTREPFGVAVYVPQAVEVGGRWKSASLYGSLRTKEAETLAYQIAYSIEFADPAKMPRRPVVAPPVIEIAPE